jgi:hypothetical protein
VWFNSVNLGGARIPAFRVLDGEGKLLEGVEDGEEWVRNGLKEVSTSKACKSSRSGSM